MHLAVLGIAPLARRHAFSVADSVLYYGQINRNDYAREVAHRIYVRDRSEIFVFGSSAAVVEERAQELRLQLDESIEYISGVVYVEGLSSAKAR